MQSELENAKRVADQAKAQATELAKRTASLNSELEKTNAQRNELQTKLDQATSEIKSAQSQLEDKQSRLGGMQSELENAKRVADQAKAQATEFAKRNASLNSELEKRNAQHNELQTNLSSAPSSEAPETASQPLTRADCDKAGMQWSDSANVCGTKSEELKTQAASEAPPEALTDGTASQPLTRIDCDKANMVWNESANVCGEKSEGTEPGAAPKIEAGPQTLSTAASNQPLTRSDCDKAGMAWNERGNVCGAKTSSVKPPPLPVRKPPEPTKVTSVKPPPLPLRISTSTRRGRAEGLKGQGASVTTRKRKALRRPEALNPKQLRQRRAKLTQNENTSTDTVHSPIKLLSAHSGFSVIRTTPLGHDSSTTPTEAECSALKSPVMGRTTVDTWCNRPFRCPIWVILRHRSDARG